MMEEFEQSKKWLEEYARENDIYKLNSEDILKLIEKPYPLKMIESAFNISSNELAKIRKTTGITNIYLERRIRSIYAILYYIDNQDRNIPDDIRNKIINTLVFALSEAKPRRDFYKKKLQSLNFSREVINEEIEKREIDIEYRLKDVSQILGMIDKLIDHLLDESKNISKNSQSDFLENQEDERKNNVSNNDLTPKDNRNIKINVDGNELTYKVSISDEKYSINKSTSNRKSNGSHNNHSKSNKKKTINGKIGEKIVLENEKMNLKLWGLDHLVDKVQLIAQVDDEITLDGLGYDLISYNEFGEKICIEVKFNQGSKDKSFFISKKEIEVMEGICKVHDCKYSVIYYLLNDNENITIKKIYPDDFKKYKLEPVLYKVVATDSK